MAAALHWPQLGRIRPLAYQHLRDTDTVKRLRDELVLADVIARENQMTPVTDQPSLCATTSGWTIEAMARILLTDEPEAAATDQPDYSHAFAVLALQTVLPRDLSDVPVERIIEARRRLLPELVRYRDVPELAHS